MIAPLPSAMGAGEAPGTGHPAVPARGRPVQNVFVVAACRIPIIPGRATTTRGPGAPSARRADSHGSRPGQRPHSASPGRALAATFFRLIDRVWATAKLTAVLVVVGLLAAAVAADTWGGEPPQRTVEFAPSPETADAPEGLPAKNDRPGHPEREEP